MPAADPSVTVSSDLKNFPENWSGFAGLLSGALSAASATIAVNATATGTPSKPARRTNSPCFMEILPCRLRTRRAEQNGRTRPRQRATHHNLVTQFASPGKPALPQGIGRKGRKIDNGDQANLRARHSTECTDRGWEKKSARRCYGLTGYSLDRNPDAFNRLRVCGCGRSNDGLADSACRCVGTGGLARGARSVSRGAKPSRRYEAGFVSCRR